MCQLGWTMQPDDGGCIDIDECALGTDTCKTNEFCVNNEGTFECLRKYSSPINNGHFTYCTDPTKCILQNISVLLLDRTDKL